jgi:hypothetical protein
MHLSVVVLYKIFDIIGLLKFIVFTLFIGYLA